MVIVWVLAKVFGQAGDALGQERNLHLGRTRITFMNLKVFDDLVFIGFL